jgi:ATP/maltotriose-dependent transcriptional regulator MalT
VEVLNYLCQESLLNFNQFQKILGSKRESEFISVLYRLPGLKYFFGREGERNAFKKWLDSEASRVFLLKGIAGMGKTTYLTKVIQENKQRWNIFFYSIKEWSTPRNIISHIGHFLERLKKTSVSSLLENRGDFNIDESILLLEEPIKDTRTLMIFDDIQKADERIIQFFRALVGSDIVQDVKLVLAGRELTDIGQTNVEEIFTGLELKGLERSPSKQLLASRGIPKSKFDTIYDYTGGHPLALELVETKNGMPDMNLKMFIREEIVPKLSGPETEILRFVSIFRYPLTADALLPEHGGEEETTVHGTGIPLVEKLGKKKKWASEKRKISRLVDRLVKRSFLIYNGDSYYLHDIFRDFFYKRMDAGTRKRFHLLASDYYRRMDSDPARVETIYHLISADKMEDALEQLNTFGDTLMKRGFSEELRELFQEVSAEEASVIGSVGLNYYMGEMQYLLGDWDEALARYRRSIEACDGLKMEELTTRAKIRVARIRSLMGKQEEALEEYNEVIRLARKHDQFLLESDAVKQVGSRHYFMGNLKKLKEFHKRAMEIADRTKSRECLANAYFLNTFLTKLNGDYDRCEQLHKESLRIYEELGNQAQALMVVNNLGDLYYTLERWRDALEMFESLRDISESIGPRSGSSRPWTCSRT